MASLTLYPHIVKENGQPARLERHPRVRVAQIVMDYLAHGWSPEEICHQYPHLQHAEVYAAMTYYHDHRDEIDAEIQSELKQLEIERGQATPSPFYLRMRASGRL
jgi:uncharacterized protein (DUF433 family)